MDLPASYYGELNAKNPVLACFRRETESFLRLMKQVTSTTKRDNSSYAKGIELLMKIRKEYKHRIPERFYQEHVLQVADMLCEYKLYQLALWHGYGCFLLQLSSVQITDITDVDHFMACFFPEGFELEQGTFTIKTRAMFGCAICIFEEERKHSILSQKGLSILLKVLNFIRIMMQAFQQHEHLSWLIYNGSLSIYNICRYLMTMNCSEQALEYLLWASISLELSIPLMTPRYLPLIVALYCSVCQCYYDNQAEQQAEDFAKRALGKINDMASLENEAECTNALTQKAYRTASLKLGVLVFKRTVFESRKLKTTLRSKNKSTLKEIPHIPWPRTPTEQILVNQFDCTAGQFLAISEALWESHTRPLERKLPDEPELLEMIIELLSAGMSILSGGTSAVEQKSEDYQSFCPNVLTTESTLVDLATEGENKIQITSAVKFIKLLFKYKQPEAFSELTKEMLHILSGVEGPPFRKAERELTLLYSYSNLLCSQRENTKEDKRDDRQKFFAAVSDELVGLVDTLHLCVFGPDPELQPNPDLIFDILVFLWKRLKNIMQSHHLEIQDSLNDQQKLQCYDKLLWCLSVLCDVAIICELANVDCIMVAEMIHMLGEHVERVLGRINQADGSFCGRSEDMMQSSVSLLKESNTNLLKKVCEVTKKGLDALSKGVSALIPQDCSAITDTACMQNCKFLHPCSPSFTPAEEKNGTDKITVNVEEEKETKGESKTEGHQDMESKNLFMLAKDFHLGLDIIYHKASVKLLLLKEVKESDLLHRVKKNKLSKAHLMMQKASAEHSKGKPDESSKIRSLLEESLVLVEEAELEEMKTYMATVKNVNEKKHKTDDEGEKAPPPPMLISRTDHSITFVPAEYDLKKRVSWYQLYGRTFQGVNSKVRLGECSLPGTGNMVPVVSGECLLKVEGLQFNQKYVFAVAAYDSKGQLMGNSIGDTTLPVLACLPTPVLSTWAHLAQVAFETGQYAVAKRACRKLWSQYIDPDCSSNSKHNRFSSSRLHMDTLQHSSPHICKMFLNSIFTETEINIQQASLHWDTCGDKGPFIWEQEARLAETERMMLAMDLAIYFNDGGASLRAVVTCYRLLAPLIYHQIACDPVVQVLLKCLVVLEDNSSLMKQKWTGNSSEFLLHMVSCITYYLSMALQTFRKYESAAAVLDCGRSLVQDVFDTHFKFGKLILQAGNDKAAAIAAAESQRKVSQLIKALHVKSIRCIVSEEDLNRENEIALVTLEDPIVLYRLFPSLSLQDNFDNVIKLQRKKYFLEFASLLLRRTMEKGNPDLVLDWGLSIFLALSRRDEILGLATKTVQENSKSKEGESPKTRKKSEVPQSIPTFEELRRKLRKKLPQSLLRNLKTLKELHIVEHLLFLMSFVVQRNKKRIQLRNLIAEERAERSFLNYCMAMAHLANIYQGMRLINDGHLDERYSQLDICLFSLAHSGIMMRKYSLPSSESKGELRKASSRKVDIVTPKAERKRREAVRKVIHVTKGSIDEKNDLFQNADLKKDTQKRSSYVLLNSVENAALYFRRAMVLAHRGNHWTTLQYMCQSVWDQNHKLTAMAQNGALNKSLPPVTTDELQAIFTPLLVLATDFMLDMLTKLQIWSLYDLDVTVEELESRLHFSSPYDDCFLVDLRWVRTLVLYTLEQLHFCGKWETLAHFALLYNSYTRERYTLMIVPLLVHAQRNLLERISSFRGPAVPQPHHVKTENTTGKKMTNRTYAGYQLLSVWNRPPARKHSFHKKGAKKVSSKDPFSLKVSELHLAMSLVRVPLVVEDTLSCFREALGKRSPSLPLLQHSRSLVIRLLACTQPCFAPQTPTCRTRGGTSRPANEVTFSPAVVTSPDLLPDDLLEEDFSSPNAIYSLPISLNSVSTVATAYTNSIKDLQANGHDSLHILALHEIGNLHFYTGNISNFGICLRCVASSAAHSCWSKAVDCIFHSSGFIQQWDGVNFESSFSQNIVKQAGIWGCLQGAVLAAKIAQFISTSDIRKRTKRCRLSAHFFKCVLCCSMAHPQKDLQYSSHIIRDELFPGVDLFSEPHRLQIDTTVASLHFVCHWLFITGYYITLFPILALYLYFVGPVCRDVQRTAQAKILKVRALTELCMFTEAITEAFQFTQGADLFLPSGLHVTTANRQPVRTFCSNASLPDNMEAVEDLVNCDFTSEVCTLYGPTLCSKFNLARIQLILAITKSVRGSPVSDSEESCSSPECKEVHKEDIAQNEQERHETGGSSPKTETPKVVSFATEKRELSPERIKFLLLEAASTLISSAMQQLNSLTCSKAEKLELMVEFSLLKANLYLQQENYALSSEAAVSALVLLQTSPVTVTPLPPGSKQDTKGCSVTDNLQRDMSKAVEAHERTGVLLWLRCRLTLVHCLTANIPATATLFPGKNINEEIYQVIQQGLDECLQWGDKDIQALFMVKAVELEAQRNRIDECMAMLKKAVKLLTGRTCMPPGSVLTLSRATLLLSDLKKEQSITLLKLTQKLLEKKLCQFDETIIWLDGNIHFSPPGPKNIYLPYIDMLNKITMQIDSVLNVGNVEGSAFVQSSLSTPMKSQHLSDNTEKDSQAVSPPSHES